MACLRCGEKHRKSTPGPTIDGLKMRLGARSRVRVSGWVCGGVCVLIQRVCQMETNWSSRERVYGHVHRLCWLQRFKKNRKEIYRDKKLDIKKMSVNRAVVGWDGLWGRLVFAP